jgi:surfeit locus 1 family protein
METQAKTSYAFVLRPKWIFGHLLAITMIAIMVWCGFWQLSRLHEKRQIKQNVAARSTQPVIDVAELFPVGGSVDVDQLEYRNVRATGTFDGDNEVLVRNRTDGDGQQGFGLLTPLVLDDGRAIIVERGWIAATLGEGIDQRPVPGVELPPGQQSVTGLLLTTESRGLFGPTDPPTGQLATLSRVDLERYQSQVPYELIPMTLLIERQSSTPFDAVPRPFSRPSPSEGSHLSYAGQWFLFSTIVAIGWPIVLIRTARGKRTNKARI